MMNFKTTQDLEACLNIRRKVFIDEQKVPEELENDGLDLDCIQYLGLSGTAPVATCRVRLIDSTAKIERVAVLKAHRGRGIGRELMLYVIQESIENPAVKRIKLGAQITAVDFYKRLGFEQTGDYYMDAGIKHIDMVRNAQ